MNKLFIENLIEKFPDQSIKIDDKFIQTLITQVNELRKIKKNIFESESNIFEEINYENN